MPHESPWLDGAEETIIGSLQAMMFQDIVKIAALLEKTDQPDAELYTDIKNQVNSTVETIAKSLASQICLMCGKLSDSCRSHRISIKTMELAVCSVCFKKAEEEKDFMKNATQLWQAILYTNPKGIHIANDIMDEVKKAVMDKAGRMGL